MAIAQNNPITESDIITALNDKANYSHFHTKSDITDFNHNHDDRYYTENEIDTKVNQLKSDLVAKASMLSYEEIMASTPPIDLDIGIPKASALKHLKPVTIYKTHTSNPSTSYVEQTGCRITIPANSIYGIYVEREYYNSNPKEILISKIPPTTEEYKYPIAYDINNGHFRVLASVTGFESSETNIYIYAKDNDDMASATNPTRLYAWYITF